MGGMKNLLAVYSQESDIPEDVKDFYKQDGELFILSVKPSAGYGLDKIDELRSKLGEAISTRDTVKGKLKLFGDLDPEAALKAIKDLEELKKLDPTKDAEAKALAKANQIIEEKTKALTSKHTQELETLTTQNQKLKGEISKRLIDTAVMEAVTKHKGNSVLLSPVVRGAIQVKETDEGGHKVEVMDGQGQVRYSMRAGNNAPMSVEEYVETLRNEDAYAPAFEGNGQAGGGAGSGAGSGNKGGTGRKIRLPMSTLQDPDAMGRYTDKINAGEVEFVD